VKKERKKKKKVVVIVEMLEVKKNIEDEKFAFLLLMVMWRLV
jgi:hypothetical protein